MGYIVGVILVVLGLAIIAFGDKNIRQGEREGIVLRFFSMPSLHVKFVKWAVGILCIWFGIALLFGGGTL